MFVNDSSHLNSCHSSVKGREGEGNVCSWASNVLRNASLLHKLNLALQMRRQKFCRSVPVNDSPPMLASDESLNFKKEGKVQANPVESVDL